MGAGVSLLVAGVLTLVVFSSLVAFEGFPGFEPTQKVSEVRLPDVPPAVREDGDRSRPATEVRLAKAKRVERRSADAAAAVPAPRQQTAGEYVTRTQPQGGGTEVRAGAPHPVADPVVVPDPSSPAEPRPATDRLVEDVTRQVQQVLDPVTQATEQTTRAVTDGVNDLLRP